MYMHNLLDSASEHLLISLYSLFETVCILQNSTYIHNELIQYHHYTRVHHLQMKPLDMMVKVLIILDRIVIK